MENSLNRRVRRLTWTEYGHYIDRLMSLLEEEQIKRTKREVEWDEVVGVPRGGLSIAVSVSHRLGIPISTRPFPLTPTLLFVDDIVDSGETRARRLKSKPSLGSWVSIFVRPETAQLADVFVEVTEDWIQFPYEKE